MSITINMEEAINRMGDKEIYLEISKFFALTLPESIQSLQQALENSNMPEATRLAHSMKSNCSTMGADSLRDICARLESQCRAEEQKKAITLFAAITPQLKELEKRLLALQ